MAEESDLSRTEPASPRRLQAARQAGDVPRSAEWSAWLVLLAALGFLAWSAAGLLESMQALLASAFRHAAQPYSTPLNESIFAVLWAALPVLVASFVAALAAPLVMSGWVFAPAASRAELARARPFQVFARVFSADAWFEGGLGMLKLVLAAFAVAWTLIEGWPELQRLSSSSTATALDSTLSWVGQGVIALAAALAAVAVIDAGWRWWRYLRRHAMTWQEVLAEAREAEGSPELRARIRSRQQQAGRAPVSDRPTIADGADARPRSVDEVIG